MRLQPVRKLFIIGAALASEGMFKELIYAVIQTFLWSEVAFKAKSPACHVYNGVSIIRIIILEDKIRSSTALIAGWATMNGDG